ncbi:MAG: hypothetical protein LBV75_06265 [Paludibacter sp.]|jgi:hypothetical protein|nr:hypothetical protein [Paludibacter sp.]
MATIILNYDARSISIRKAIELLLTLGAKVETPKQTYDENFVSKIRNAEKEDSKKLNLSDYGISI